MTEQERQRMSPLEAVAELRSALEQAQKRIDALERENAALLESQAGVRALLDRAPAAAFVRDREGRFLFINAEYERLYGVTGEEACGRLIGDLFSAQQTEDYARHDDAVLATGLPVEEEIELDIGGQAKTYASLKFPIQDEAGAIIGLGGIEYDITERRAAERALHISEARFRNIVEGLKTDIFFATFDENEMVTYVSPAITKVLGYRQEECLAHWGMFVEDEESQRTVERVIGELLAGKTPELYEVEVKHKDGSRRVLEVQETPTFSDDGAFAGSDGIYRDITRRKEAEAELARNQARMRHILDSGPIGVSISGDEYGESMFANRRFREMFGLGPAEDLDGMDWRPFFADPEVRVPLHRRFQEEGFVKDAVCRMRRRDGSCFWALINYVRMDGGDSPSRLSWYYDITEQKQAEEALREREEQLQRTLETAPIGVSFVKQSGEFLFANSRVCELAGLPREAFLKRTAPEFYADPREREEVYGLVQQHGAVRDREMRLKNARGETVWALFSLLPMERGADVFINWVYDITDRKEAENALREEKERTELALADLERAQERLVEAEKMASLGQLTAGIAHELKNPLNFVNNFADTSIELLDELGEIAAPLVGGLSDDQQEEVQELLTLLTDDIGKIASHGKRADSIIKSMLLHARGDTGERRETEINALVEEAVGLAYHGERARDRAFNAEIEMALDPAAGSAELVSQEITRVLVNLFTNAFYAMKQRAGEAGYAPHLTVGTEACLGSDGQEEIRIRVRDNGAGISAEVREKLFTPFYTTKPSGEGTGLGLSISYDIIVQQHGGSLGVISEPGRFTEFRIALPRRAPR